MTFWESFWFIAVPILLLPPVVGYAGAWLLIGHNPLHRGPCPTSEGKEHG